MLWKRGRRRETKREKELREINEALEACQIALDKLEYAKTRLDNLPDEEREIEISMIEVSIKRVNKNIMEFEAKKSEFMR